MHTKCNPNRRNFMTSAAATTLGIALTPTLVWSESHAVMLDAFQAADVDWRAFDGETLIVGAMKHPWSEAIKDVLPIFENLTGINVTLSTQSETEYVSEMPNE